MTTILRILLLSAFGLVCASAIMGPGEATSAVALFATNVAGTAFQLCGMSGLAIFFYAPLFAFFGIALCAAVALNATVNFIQRPVLAHV